MTIAKWFWMLIFALLVSKVYGPPPNRGAVDEPAVPKNANTEQERSQTEEASEPPRPLYEFAYSRYLEKVVAILESDPKFTEKLKSMPEQDIKSGKIADHIDDLGPDVFDQLTKVKLAEIERLREVIAKQIEANGGAQDIEVPEHIDVNNWEKFGKEDLRKLIQKTVADMDKMDRQRKQEFKEYEMRKRAEADHKMVNMTPEEREKYKKELEAQRERHNQHERVKHPGSRDQLEEVWEKSDKLEKDSFNLRTFFALHDLNGDGLLSESELQALFRIELEKIYNDTNPDDDPRERMEEIYRMREHVMKQMDKNGDRMISLEEFLNDAEAQQANRDEGWKDIGDQPVYTDEELQKFEAEYAKQQGWGEYAYSTPAPTPAPVRSTVYQGGYQQQQNMQQQAVPQQQQQAIPQQAVPQQQQAIPQQQQAIPQQQQQAIPQQNVPQQQQNSQYQQQSASQH
uniref:EF-hand domain-containing protein n=1 Tax=Syphacia muris TaxID=451379 RepID=A0A0N5AZG1_9BILA